jgi:hypothetical protein
MGVTRKKQHEYYRRFYRGRKYFGVCHRCRQKADSKRTLCEKHLAQAREVSRQRRHALKVEIFNKYGGPRCKCCGETIFDFLTLDHIKGGGTAHRREIDRAGTTFYSWLKKNHFPKGYRVLCMNCNLAIGHTGECPHEKRRRLLRKIQKACLR